MRILVWNIRQGGGTRRQRISEAIARHSPDVAALIEFVHGGTPLLTDALRDAGLGNVIASARKGRDYTICIASKHRMEQQLADNPMLTESGLWLEVTLPDFEFGIAVIHAPTSPDRKMREFMRAVAEHSALRASEPFLLAGDFNTGEGPIDGPIGKTFSGRYRALRDAGMKDVWREFHPDAAEYTWGRNERFYRIDHAMASLALMPAISMCRYSHAERLSGLSDHSLMIVDLILEVDR